MIIDDKVFRQALGCCPTGVSVITTLSSQGGPVGVTIGSFASLSLNPPLVLFCLDNANAHLSSFRENGAFVVNILAEGQQSLSNRFGSRTGQGWDGLDFTAWDDGLPKLSGCLANLFCRITEEIDGGDHKIFIGRVENVISTENGDPLLYFRGSYRALAPKA